MEKVKVEFVLPVDQVQPLIAACLLLDPDADETPEGSPAETVIITELAFILEKILDAASYFATICEREGDPLSASGKAAVAAWIAHLDEAQEKHKATLR